MDLASLQYSAVSSFVEELEHITSRHVPVVRVGGNGSTPQPVAYCVRHLIDPPIKRAISFYPIELSISCCHLKKNWYFSDSYQNSYHFLKKNWHCWAITVRSDQLSVQNCPIFLSISLTSHQSIHQLKIILLFEAITLLCYQTAYQLKIVLAFSAIFWEIF